MEYKWSDILDIAIDLSETYPEIDAQWISFPDLHHKICSLKILMMTHHPLMKKYLKQFRWHGWLNQTNSHIMSQNSGVILCH